MARQKSHEEPRQHDETPYCTGKALDACLRSTDSTFVPCNKRALLLGVLGRFGRFCVLLLFHYDLRFAEISVWSIHRLAQFARAPAFSWASSMLELHTSGLGHLDRGSWGRSPRANVEILWQSRPDFAAGHERQELV